MFLFKDQGSDPSRSWNKLYVQRLSLNFGAWWSDRSLSRRRESERRRVTKKEIRLNKAGKNWARNKVKRRLTVETRGLSDRWRSLQGATRCWQLNPWAMPSTTKHRRDDCLIANFNPQTSHSKRATLNNIAAISKIDTSVLIWSRATIFCGISYPSHVWCPRQIIRVLSSMRLCLG